MGRKKYRGLKFAIFIIARSEGHTTKEDVREFVAEAIETWGGQRDPNDDLFGSLDTQRIIVEEVR